MNYDRIAASEAAISSALAACTAAAEENRLAAVARNRSNAALAEAQLALSKVRSEASTSRTQPPFLPPHLPAQQFPQPHIPARESQIQARPDISRQRADEQLQIHRPREVFDISHMMPWLFAGEPMPMDPFAITPLFSHFLMPAAFDPLSALGNLQISMDGKTIIGAMDYGHILGLDRLDGYAQFLEWSASGDVAVGLTSAQGATSAGIGPGTIMWHSNGMLENFLGPNRQDTQIEGFLGHGVRGGMLVNVNEGRLSLHVRPHFGEWRQVFETPLPRASYRLKYSTNPGGSIEVLGVRKSRQ
jgi:hypothetical protein